MIRGIGEITSSTYSQTLNMQDSFCRKENEYQMEYLSGPFLVSRTGDEGWTYSRDKVYK